jgi:hypothetical protein
MIEEELAVVLHEGARQIRVVRVGDRLHEITFPTRDVVDVELPPGSFGRNARAARRA